MPNVKADLKLGNKIGNGCFGEVFEGDDPVHGKVAVKVFRRDYPQPESDAAWKARNSMVLMQSWRKFL